MVRPATEPGRSRWQQKNSGAVTYNELSGNYPEGSDVAAFPYRYTIK